MWGLTQRGFVGVSAAKSSGRRVLTCDVAMCGHAVVYSEKQRSDNNFGTVIWQEENKG
jgi:hypothetical protein